MISKKTYNEIIKLNKEGKSAYKIAETLNIARSTVQAWLKKDCYKIADYYHCPFRNKYDFKLFKTLNNLEFAKKYGISRERAGQLRKKYASNTSTIEINNESKKYIESLIDADILQFIENNIKKSNLNFTIKEFCNQYKYNDHKINLNRFLKVAKSNNLDIIKYEKYKHGSSICKKNKCKCDIFNLANAIKTRSNAKKIPIKMKDVDYFANNFIDFYKNDTSRYHKIFYSMIDEELSILNNRRSEQLQNLEFEYIAKLPNFKQNKDVENI